MKKGVCFHTRVTTYQQKWRGDDNAHHKKGGSSNHLLSNIIIYHISYLSPHIIKYEMLDVVSII